MFEFKTVVLIKDAFDTSIVMEPQCLFLLKKKEKLLYKSHSYYKSEIFVV